jgi:hypothetical protein
MEEEDEEADEEYIFVSLEGVDTTPASLNGTLVIEGLLTNAPTITIGAKRYRGAFSEDVGSTLFFDRAALKGVADAQDRASRESTLGKANMDPLVCVTVKRLCLNTSRNS